jgi:hypothetical protein
MSLWNNEQQLIETNLINVQEWVYPIWWGVVPPSNYLLLTEDSNDYITEAGEYYIQE